MALPDKYADEPTQDLDPDKVTLWRNAQDAANRWQEHADALKRDLIEAMGTAHAGLIDGQKVLTYRPTKKIAEASLIKEYPDLVNHYMVERRRLELDLEAFQRQHQDVAEKYRVRQFRWLED